MLKFNEIKRNKIEPTEECFPPTHPEKPWLDARGFPLTMEQLQAVSCTWTGATWERYLESLEVSRREDLGVRADRQILLEQFEKTEAGEEASLRDLAEYEPDRDDRHDTVSDISAALHEKPAHRDQDSEEIIPQDAAAVLMVFESVTHAVDEGLDLYSLVEEATQLLTPNESVVIWQLFWEGRTERQISSLMHRSRRSIRTWRVRAFSKLRIVLSPIFRRNEKADPSFSQNIPKSISRTKSLTAPTV